MAKPELEDGFTRIANEILENLAKAQLSGHEMRILMALFRKTYGFMKKSDCIGISQWESMTGIGRRRIWSTLKSLQAKNIIVIIKKGFVNEYSFQKDYEKWNSDVNSTVTKTAYDKSGTVTKTVSTSDENVTKNSDENVTHKRNKETITKESKDSDGPQFLQSDKPTKEPTESQLMFEALAEVCCIDWRSASQKARGELNRIGAVFRKANYQPPDIKSMGEWWYANDWRGQKGQPPTPNQLRDSIGTWEAFKNGKIKPGVSNDRRRTQDYGSERLRQAFEGYKVVTEADRTGIYADSEPDQ